MVFIKKQFTYPKLSRNINIYDQLIMYKY